MTALAAQKGLSEWFDVISVQKTFTFAARKIFHLYFSLKIKIISFSIPKKTHVNHNLIFVFKTVHNPEMIMLLTLAKSHFRFVVGMGGKNILLC